MNDAIKIFVDADALVALTVETDTNHEKARSLLHRLTVNPVLFLNLKLCIFREHHDYKPARESSDSGHVYCKDAIDGKPVSDYTSR